MPCPSVNTPPLFLPAGWRGWLVLRSACLVLLLCAVMLASAVLGPGFDFDHQIQLATSRYGMRAKQTMTQWRDLLLSLQTATQEERVRKVHEFVNDHVTYAEDSVTWRVSDYWATPLETLSRGVGDCEDYAIAKYFSLLIAGVPSSQLRMTYVKARLGGLAGNSNAPSIAHMVLAYYPTVTGEPLILDSLLDAVKPASQRPDLTPVFSFNSDGLWVGVAQGTTASGSSTARLSMWRNLIAKMQTDGFE
jgi:predicted transglutaminase-like cysteine proteinase